MADCHPETRSMVVPNVAVLEGDYLSGCSKRSSMSVVFICKAVPPVGSFLYTPKLKVP